MFFLLIFCPVGFLLSGVIGCSGNSTVIHFSVPENHQICLQCGSSDSSGLMWTNRDQKVLVSRQGDDENNTDAQRYLLLVDGALCLLRLADADAGEFRCNRRPVAELQVLTGRDFLVAAGRTLLLPCSGSSKPKKRWLHRGRGEGGAFEPVLTVFRNGTVKPERSRISFQNGALQIQDLQPGDAGEYLCNKELQARLTVLTGQPEPTRIPQTTSTTPAAVVMETAVADINTNKKKSAENVLMLVVVGLTFTILLLIAAVGVLLTSRKCRRNKRSGCSVNTRTLLPSSSRLCSSSSPGLEDTELQPWTPPSSTPAGSDVHEEVIHYASLGRHTWRERPGRTPPDQDHHHVIYSAVITRPPPAGQKPRLPVAGGK